MKNFYILYADKKNSKIRREKIIKAVNQGEALNIFFHRKDFNLKILQIKQIENNEIDLEGLDEFKEIINN